MNRIKSIWFVVSSVALGTTLSCPAQPKIEEKIVAPEPTMGVVYTLSPKGMHVAAQYGKNGRQVVAVDNVEGPLFDQVILAAGGTVVKYSEDGFNLRSEIEWNGPVAFSPDGMRHAYAARDGKDDIVILDGKEIFRAPTPPSGTAVDQLRFSPDSKHVFFLNSTTNSYQSYQLMMDGQPVTPPFEGKQKPVFSADGSRWALAATKPRMTNVKLFIVDGKDAGYPGEQPQFTPEGKHLVCITRQWQKGSVLVDGKELVAGQSVDKFVISPTGDIGAIVIPGSDGRKKFFLNGKPVVDDAADVVFSPDGKRWAAVCALNQKAWVVMNDGQKQKEYWPIQNVAFTPDSSKCVYVATTGGKDYVVVNGKEDDDGNVLLHYRPMYSATGNAILYEAGFMMGKLSVHYNDHVEPQSLGNFHFTLSPDGGHYLYYRKDVDNQMRLIEDGATNAPSAMQMGGPIFFSPDSKHFVAPLFQSFWCERQKIVFTATPLGFTPDSQHLILKGRDSTPEGVMLDTYYVNGDLVAKFSARGTTWAGVGIHKAWEQQPDGTIVFVGNDTGLVGGLGPVKRITVTPDPNINVASWVTNFKASEAKAAEDAAVAKKKAEEEAAAAAAKRKVDYEAAVAAKNKARQDALNAKKLKVLNAQRAKQGLPPLTELPEE